MVMFMYTLLRSALTYCYLSAATTFLSLLVAGCGLRQPLGDLKSILNKANCAAPDQHYESANSLSADLRAFLDHKPVSTRRATAVYRATLFARRRPEFFYPVVILGAAILLGALHSIAMDYSAQRSRIQAQARLRQLQQLTYSLESDIYEPVSKLPESKAARETLIHWTAESLKGLAAQAGDDAQLRAQLAQSYNRLAEMQRSNGDAAQALVSEQLAREVLNAKRTQ